MTDGVLIQLIISIASVFISLIGAVVTIVVNSKVNRADKKLEDVSKEVQVVKTQTNGLTSQLVEAAARTAYAAGEKKRRSDDIMSKDSDLGTLR